MRTEQKKTAPEGGRRRVRVLNAPIDAMTWDDALARIRGWARAHESRYVCISNTHSVVSAQTEPGFDLVLEGADMATPDGAPVACLMRRLGVRDQERINGPDLMWRYCEAAAQRGESIYLYGSTEATLARLQAVLAQRLPALRVAGAQAPPFRPLTPQEDAEAVSAINASGAGTVWVSLGCPKQERWMAEHRGRVQAVMIGVGAAFDYHAGTIARAPLWMQQHGLEWLHRLWSEPRRLWRRYLVTSTLFLIGAARQLWLFHASR